MSNYLTDHRIIAVSRPDKRINLFIQGGTSSSFVLPKDVTAIEEYAFHNISGLTEVVFTNQDVVVEVDGNSGIPANAKFIVPAKFLSDYQTKYPNRTVETRGVIWTVPYVGDSTLTAVYINQCILAEPEIVNAEVVIVPENFTDYESGAFDVIFTRFTELAMIESPWLNGTKTNGMEWIIPIDNSISSSLVTSSIANIGNQAANYINNVSIKNTVSSFADKALEPLFASLPNIASGIIKISGSNYIFSAESLFGSYYTSFVGKLILDNDVYTGQFWSRFKCDFELTENFHTIRVNTFNAVSANLVEFKANTLTMQASEIQGFYVKKLIARGTLSGTSPNFTNSAQYYPAFYYEDTKQTYLSSGNKWSTMKGDINVVLCTDGVLFKVSNAWLDYQTENFSISPNGDYSHDFLVAIIAGLYDYSGGTAHTATFGSTNLAKLTAEEIAVATNKGWTLA